jgi:hypothetical protein
MPVTINGTNGITFNNSSTQAQSAGLGSGATAQTWQNVLGSRVNNTTYTNSTGYPIMVSVSSAGAANTSWSAIVAGNTIGGASIGPTAFGHNCMFIVPNGSTYSVNFLGAAINNWWELR